MKLSPITAASAAALIFAPVSALAFGSLDGLVDQGIAWLAATISTIVVASLAGVITKVTGATLDAKARVTLEKALGRAASLGLAYVLDEASRTAIGQRIEEAVRSIMVPYALEGAAGAISRFGIDPTAGDMAAVAKSRHLEDMARADLLERLGAVRPDLLSQAMKAATGHRIPIVDQFS